MASNTFSNIAYSLPNFNGLNPGYNTLNSNININSLNISNFDDTLPGYNVIWLPASQINTCVMNVCGVDNPKSTLLLGENASMILIGNSSSITKLFGTITHIDAPNQIMYIGATSSKINLGIINSSLANISTINACNGNISTINAYNGNIDNLSVINLSVINLSVSGIINALPRECNAIWHTTVNLSANNIIGNGNISIIQNNGSPLTVNGTFKCGYTGIYICSVTAILYQGTNTGIYLYQNNVSIASYIAYGTNTESFSGCVCVKCNASDTLSFYLADTSAIQSGGLNKMQLCSIALAF